MFEFKPASSNPSPPQPQHYQSLPHSSKRAIFNPFRFNELHTLGKTPRGILPPSPFWNPPRTASPPSNPPQPRYYSLCAPLPQLAASVYNQTYGSPPPLAPQGPGNS